ncbi:MAG: hypothetical protein ABEI52_06775, partial [Halobacteriaceae archaeon]
LRELRTNYQLEEPPVTYSKVLSNVQVRNLIDYLINEVYGGDPEKLLDALWTYDCMTAMATIMCRWIRPSELVHVYYVLMQERLRDDPRRRRRGRRMDDNTEIAVGELSLWGFDLGLLIGKNASVFDAVMQAYDLLYMWMDEPPIVGLEGAKHTLRVYAKDVRDVKNALLEMRGEQYNNNNTGINGKVERRGRQNDIHTDERYTISVKELTTLKKDWSYEEDDTFDVDVEHYLHDDGNIGNLILSTIAKRTSDFTSTDVDMYRLTLNSTLDDMFGMSKKEVESKAYMTFNDNLQTADSAEDVFSLYLEYLQEQDIKPDIDELGALDKYDVPEHRRQGFVGDAYIDGEDDEDGEGRYYERPVQNVQDGNIGSINNNAEFVKRYARDKYDRHLKSRSQKEVHKRGKKDNKPAKPKGRKGPKGSNDPLYNHNGRL